MHAHTRSLLSTFIVLSFALFLTLSVAPIPLGDASGGTALADPSSGWEEQDISVTEGEITAISASSQSMAWATFGPPLTPGAQVLKTDNGGSDWSIQNIDTTDVANTDICVVDGSAVWAIGMQNAYKTVNGGLTWSRVFRSTISPSGGGLLQDICALDAHTALHVTYFYNSFSGWPYTSWWDVFRTSDGGMTWTSCVPDYLTASPVFYEDVSSVDVADDSTIWVSLLSSQQVVLRSTDSGVTWETHEQSGWYIYDVSAIDSLNAWAVGSEATTTPGNGTGVILKTADGGATWEVQRKESGLVLSSISAVDADVAWAAGEINTTYATADRGIILKTIDGGAAWTIQHEFAGGYLNDICAVDAATAWAGGKSPSGAPLILKTENGGETIPLTVASITPNRGTQHTIFLDIADLSGTNFITAATVRLEKGAAVLNAYNVNVVSHTEITCSVSLFGAEPGAYDVVVTNPDGEETRLPAGFTVDPLCGNGSGTALLMLGLTLGLLSLAGTASLRRKSLGE